MERETEKKSAFLGLGESDFAENFNFLILAAIVCVFILNICKAIFITSWQYFFQLTTSAELSSDATHQRLKRGQLITFSRAQGAPKGAMACWTWYVNNCKWKHAYLQYIILLNVLIIHNYYIYIYIYTRRYFYINIRETYTHIYVYRLCVYICMHTHAYAQRVCSSKPLPGPWNPLEVIRLASW